MSQAITTQLWPLGKIQPGATYASASKSILANFTGTSEIDPAVAHVVGIQAHPDNTGKIYVCNSASAPDTTNFLNVVAILEGGDQWPQVGRAFNDIDLRHVYVGAANANDFAIAYIRRA